MTRSPLQPARPALLSTAMARRSFLGLAGVGAAAVTLASCAKPAENAGSDTAASDKVDPDFIKKTFVKEPGKAAGQGLEITIGATLLLSTFQAFYGQLSLRGMELAAEQIKAAGGPSFTFVSKDIAASTTAGADAVRDFASRKIGMVLAGNIFNVGSMIGPLAQDKILGIDPGGGTATLFQKQPYAWGSRAVAPNDTFPIGLQYIKEKMPEVKKIALLNGNSGDFSKALEEDFRGAVAKYGPPGAQVDVVIYTSTNAGGDFTAALTEMRQLQPDVLFAPLYGSDPASLMKRYATTGLKAKVFGADFAASTTKIAGSAMNGYMFAGDYFDADPQNDWGRYFISTYYAKYKEVPDYFPANYYETTFIFWELVKRVIAKGGDPNDGTALQDALMEDAKFLSVYGDGSPAGSIEFDTTTHTLSSRPMGVFEVTDNVPKALAYGNIGGRDFRLA